MKRGLTHAEAIEYVGVKRRTFDEKWRPRLICIHQGSCKIFDKLDLDRLFDEFKQEAMAPHRTDGNDADGPAANDAHNGGRNGRSIDEKGETKWAKRHGGSTPARTEPGKSTSGGESLDFDKLASAVLRKRNAG